MEQRKKLLHYDKAGITEVDIDNCEDYEQIMKWKLMVDDDLAGVKQQLEDARTSVHRGGEYADPEWYHRATFAKTSLGRLSQRIGARMSINKKKNRATTDAGSELLQLFKDECKSVLPPEIYTQIWTRAQLKFAEAKPNT